jgi:hypothetical protein
MGKRLKTGGAGGLVIEAPLEKIEALQFYFFQSKGFLKPTCIGPKNYSRALHNSA